MNRIIALLKKMPGVQMFMMYDQISREGRRLKNHTESAATPIIRCWYALIMVFGLGASTLSVSRARTA